MITNKKDNNVIKFSDKFKKILIIFMMISTKIYNKKMKIYNKKMKM